MKIGVVTFPGSNCDMDMVHALSKDLGFNVVQLWHKDRDLQGVEAVVLPGGFSYGDYLRSGAIARFSPIMEGRLIRPWRRTRHGGLQWISNPLRGRPVARYTGHNESRKFICRTPSSPCLAPRPCLQVATRKRHRDSHRPR